MPDKPTVATEVPREVMDFRKEFPILEHKVHLANNSRSALCHAARAAVQEYMDGWNREGAPWAAWAARHEELRASFAKMIGARQHEIALCPSVSVAMGTVASCFDWKERPAVVFDDFSFPSVCYLWYAQRARGAEVRRVPARGEEMPPEAFDPVLDERCQILSVSHVCYRNGHLLDLKEVSKKCRDRGILFAVDDYQCCGSRPMDVREEGIDVMVTGTVKWLLGSPGVALLYVREELFDRLHPSVTGWFGQVDFSDFQIEEHREAPDARRFQAGSPAFPAIFDSLAGIDVIQSVGLEKIGSWIDTLTATAVKRAKEEGFSVSTPVDPAKRGPQVAIRTPDLNALLAELAKRDIVITGREGNVRAAFHYYNTFDDVETFISAMKELEHLVVKA